MEVQVSIIMATYNRAHFIRESLTSIINQSFKDWECLVIDDGSTDETVEVVASIEENDERIKYLIRPGNYTTGLPGCRNYGLDKAKGNYIIFFDDDDIVHPRNLEVNLRSIEHYSRDFCHYQKKPFKEQWNSDYIDVIAKPEISSIGLAQLQDIIMNKISFASCCVLWKRECFGKIRFNEDLMYAEEWECYSRILTSGFQGVSINQVLYYNRKHPDSNTGEFYSNDPVRRNSYSRAVKLVLDNLRRNDLLSAELKQYFIRMGFFFKDYSIIQYTLETVDSSTIEKSKYRLGFAFYPLLKKYFNFINDLKKRVGR
ncbi:glycosyltransferase [Salinimicrobium sp. 3283s]|uniref:glycosyltransferase family 2 protein n=1 Tax=Salinimicrobium sp. 3283s TaxID=3114359 RepID=UPI0031ED6114